MIKKRLITIVFPSVMMIFITLFTNCHLDKLIRLDYKGIFVISIVALFPLLILVQGILSAINRTNIFLSLGLSLLTTVLIGIILYSSGTENEYETIIHYVIRYLKYGVSGYVISYSLIKISSFK